MVQGRSHAVRQLAPAPTLYGPRWLPCARRTGVGTDRPPGAQRRGPLALTDGRPGIRGTAGYQSVTGCIVVGLRSLLCRIRSSQPLPEDIVQRPRGLFFDPQHTAVLQVRVQHDTPVLFGDQQVGEPCCAVCLADNHDHAR